MNLGTTGHSPARDLIAGRSHLFGYPVVLKVGRAEVDVPLRQTFSADEPAAAISDPIVDVPKLIDRISAAEESGATLPLRRHVKARRIGRVLLDLLRVHAAAAKTIRDTVRS